jgi:hypothetical protein
MVCISKAKPNPKLKASNSNICQKKMPDYRRTQKIFEEQGLSRLFKKPLELFQIYRIKRADGTEWLKSRVRLIGLDKAGNEVEHSFVDPEMFYKPLARHELKKKEPQNESSPLERVCVEAGLNPHNYQYTGKF